MYCSVYANVFVCCIHRPPNSSFDLLNRLHDVLCNLDVSPFSHFILVGDFIVDFCLPTGLCMTNYSVLPHVLLQQVVTELTHFSHSGTTYAC